MTVDEDPRASNRRVIPAFLRPPPGLPAPGSQFPLGGSTPLQDKNESGDDPPPFRFGGSQAPRPNAFELKMQRNGYGPRALDPPPPRPGTGSQVFQNAIFSPPPPPGSAPPTPTTAVFNFSSGRNPPRLNTGTHRPATPDFNTIIAARPVPIQKLGAIGSGRPSRPITQYGSSSTGPPLLEPPVNNPPTPPDGVTGSSFNFTFGGNGATMNSTQSSNANAVTPSFGGIGEPRQVKPPPGFEFGSSAQQRSATPVPPGGNFQSIPKPAASPSGGGSSHIPQLSQADFMSMPTPHPDGTRPTDAAVREMISNRIFGGGQGGSSHASNPPTGAPSHLRMTEEERLMKGSEELMSMLRANSRPGPTLLGPAPAPPLLLPPWMQPASESPANLHAHPKSSSQSIFSSALLHLGETGIKREHSVSPNKNLGLSPIAPPPAADSKISNPSMPPKKAKKAHEPTSRPRGRPRKVQPEDEIDAGMFRGRGPSHAANYAILQNSILQIPGSNAAPPAVQMPHPPAAMNGVQHVQIKIPQAESSDINYPERPMEDLLETPYPAFNADEPTRTAVYERYRPGVFERWHLLWNTNAESVKSSWNLIRFPCVQPPPIRTKAYLDKAVPHFVLRKVTQIGQSIGDKLDLLQEAQEMAIAMAEVHDVHDTSKNTYWRVVDAETPVKEKEDGKVTKGLGAKEGLEYYVVVEKEHLVFLGFKGEMVARREAETLLPVEQFEKFGGLGCDGRQGVSNGFTYLGSDF